MSNINNTMNTEMEENLTFEEQLKEAEIETQVARDQEIKELTLRQFDEDKKFNIREIVTWPNPILKQESKAVTMEEIQTPEFEQLLIDMFATLKAEQGIALAAIQVNVPKRVAVFEFTPGNRMLMINPEIISKSDQLFELQEGCISVPGVFEKNKRPASCVVRYQELLGNTVEKEFTGVFAFAVQHEIDHMNGKVFVDNFSTFKRLRFKNKVKKFLKQYNQ